MKNYYKVWIDNIQSVWLVVEQGNEIHEVYVRRPCSFDGKLVRNDHSNLSMRYKDLYRTQEISEEEAFLELI